MESRDQEIKFAVAGGSPILSLFSEVEVSRARGGSTYLENSPLSFNTIGRALDARWRVEKCHGALY